MLSFLWVKYRIFWILSWMFYYLSGIILPYVMYDDNRTMDKIFETLASVSKKFQKKQIYTGPWKC